MYIEICNLVTTDYKYIRVEMIQIKIALHFHLCVIITKSSSIDQLERITATFH